MATNQNLEDRRVKSTGRFGNRVYSAGETVLEEGRQDARFGYAGKPPAPQATSAESAIEPRNAKHWNPSPDDSHRDHSSEAAVSYIVDSEARIAGLERQQSTPEIRKAIEEERFSLGVLQSVGQARGIESRLEKAKVGCSTAIDKEAARKIPRWNLVARRKRDKTVKKLYRTHQEANRWLANLGNYRDAMSAGQGH